MNTTWVDTEKEQESRVKRRISIRHQTTYYWLLGTRLNGKRVFDARYNTFEDADKEGAMNYPTHEVFPLKTANPEIAKRMIKRILLDRSHDIEDAIKRFENRKTKEG